MANNSKQGFLVCAPMYSPLRVLTDFRFIFVNVQGARIFGRKRKAMKDVVLSEVLSTESCADAIRSLANALQSGDAHVLSLDLPATDVEPAMSREFRVVPVEGELALCALHSAEEELALRRIDELNDFSEKVLESAPVSIIATDNAGTIVAMNKAAERLTLYRKSELVGQHSLLVLHDSAEVSIRAQELSREKGQPVRAGFESLVARAVHEEADEREWAYVRRDGSRAWVSMTTTALRSHAGDITGYLSTAFDVTDRKRLADAAHHMARHDQLTGLFNRSMLADRLESGLAEMKQSGGRLAVVAVDIDYFKRVNDSLGHFGGDAVLSTVASRLKTSVRNTDTVVRVGGDEFIVILPDIGSEENAERRADLILREISMPFHVGTCEVRVTASIGVCLYPEGGLTASDLLHNADLAMYAAKNMGRGSFQSFSAAMLRASEDRMEMEEELRHAVERGQLALHYQPQVVSTTGQVESVEMLLRWKHPKTGYVSPEIFIPLAEEAGLMAEIATWSLHRACADCVDMQKRLGRRLRVAVNFSPRQLQQKRLADTVRRALYDSGLSAKDLEIEITEQTLIADNSTVVDTLAEIRELGVSMAIDDFGTGFSSFAYILRHNVDRLKIDQSFIAKSTTDPAAAAVVRTVIAMAHGLGMKVCAEGVETVEQAAFLLRRHCDELQGYLYSRPVALDELAASIQSAEAMYIPPSTAQRAELVLFTPTPEAAADTVLEPDNVRNAVA